MTGLLHPAPLREKRLKSEITTLGAACLDLGGNLESGQIKLGLDRLAAAELLLTAGTLSDSVARAKRIVGGQRLAEALISGAIALFDYTAEKTRAIEARIELGCCYYHQGLFDFAHSTLQSCVTSLTDEDSELRAVALIRLAIVERHSGRLHEALCLLEQVVSLENLISPWTKGRFCAEMANTLKEFGVSEGRKRDFDRALNYYKKLRCSLSNLGICGTSP